MRAWLLIALGVMLGAYAWAGVMPGNAKAAAAHSAQSAKPASTGAISNANAAAQPASTGATGNPTTPAVQSAFSGGTATYRGIE
jgi:hypothetical protein